MSDIILISKKKARYIDIYLYIGSVYIEEEKGNQEGSRIESRHTFV